MRIEFFESRESAIESLATGLTQYENRLNAQAGKRFIYPTNIEEKIVNDSCSVVIRNKNTGSKTLIFVYAVDRKKTLWCSWVITKSQIDGLKRFLEVYPEIDKNNLSETVKRNEELSDFAISDFV